MRVLSLFDGISCGQIALERCGISVSKYYASEINQDAIKVTQSHYPDTVQLGDVNNIDFNKFSNVDLIMGGFPCQDLSIAKQKRKSLNGTRSGLFFKMLEAIQTIQPKWFLIENVASMTKESEQIISDLLGCKPIFLNSADVCAQSRKRLYWTNIPFNFNEKPRAKFNVVKDILEKTSSELVSEYGCDLKYVETRDDKKCEKNTSYRVGNLCRKADGEIQYSQPYRVYSSYGKSVTVCSEGGGLGAKSGLYKIYDSSFDKGYHIRTLTPLEIERLQTLPDNYTNIGISKTSRLRCVGNAWTVDIIKWILSGLKKINC